MSNTYAQLPLRWVFHRVPIPKRRCTDARSASCSYRVFAFDSINLLGMSAHFTQNHRDPTLPRSDFKKSLVITLNELLISSNIIKQ